MKKTIYPQSFGTTHLANGWRGPLALGLAASASLAPLRAEAADLIAPRSLDAGNSAPASGAETLRDGQTTIRVEGENRKDVDLSVATGDNERSRVAESQRGALKIGYGLGDRWQLGVAGFGGKTVIHPKDDVFPHAETAPRGDKGRLTGAGVDVRFRLTDGEGFFNAAASVGSAFGSQGAGTAVDKAGVSDWRLGLGLSLGGLATSHVNLDLAYRGHGDDRAAGLTSQGELSGGLAAKWWFTDYVGLMTGASMRQAKVSYRDASGTTKSVALSGGEYVAGLMARTGAWDWDVHAGHRLAERGFGFGKTLVGASVAYTFGGGTTAGITRDGEPARKTKAAAKGKSKRNPQTVTEEANGPLGEKEPVSLDKLYEDLSKDANKDDPDEFESFEARQKMEKAKYGEGPDKSDLVEKELEELRAIEKKTQEEAARADKAREEAERQDRLRYQRDTAHKRRVLENEVRKEVDAIEGVTDDEATWRGLE